MDFDSFPKKKIINLILKFIKRKVGKKSVCIGLSGGIDSTLVCEFAIRALGPQKVKGITLTNERYSKDSLRKVKEYVRKKGIILEEIPTAGIKKFITNVLPKNSRLIQRATIDARVCDLIIRTKATLENRIYLGTINGTERLTGWYPKGNLVGDLCPIGGLLKEHEKEIAKFLGLEKLTETISEDAKNVCSGCGELEEFKGIKYLDLDYVLFIIETKPKNTHKELLEKKNISQKTYKTIIRRIEKVKHKLDVFPTYQKIYENI
jgi:NAD+ synthase